MPIKMEQEELNFHEMNRNSGQIRGFALKITISNPL